MIIIIQYPISKSSVKWIRGIQPFRTKSFLQMEFYIYSYRIATESLDFIQFN